MACNNPLFRYPCLPESVPAHFRKRVRNRALILGREDYELFLTKYHKTEDMFQQIPCGQCTACRLEYSRQWAIRCVLESQQYEYCWFVTLTYRDEDLPPGFKFDIETGEILFNDKGEPLRPLNDKHATDFIKRLRMRAERENLRFDDKNDIRYFYCGEFGEKYQRPHFHFIFFGLDIPDVEPLMIKRGNRIYYSQWLEDIWGKGNVVIAEVNFDTCAYVARYVMKKQKGKGAKEFKNRVKTIYFGNKTYTLDEFRDEFCRMSRRPGIGKAYFDKHKDDIYKTDSLYVQTSKGLMKVKPARYYDNLYDVEEPEKMAIIKLKRKSVGKAASLHRKKQTSLTDKEYLYQKEEALKEKIKLLKREVE